MKRKSKSINRCSRENVKNRKKLLHDNLGGDEKEQLKKYAKKKEMRDNVENEEKEY